jgi:hypothetical protein
MLNCLNLLVQILLGYDFLACTWSRLSSLVVLHGRRNASLPILRVNQLRLKQFLQTG